MNQADYYTLGRSGLRVSRLALGALTFGNTGIRGEWGAPEEVSRALFDRYLESGGNLIDTSDLYTSGASETLLGKFMAESGNRDRIALTTKYSYSTEAGNPNAAGNGRKHMIAALDASLRRLRTDYIDLYLLHTWDRVTPVEEVMHTLNDQVRAGKIRYAGMSDVPAWYAARAQTYAEAHALSPLVNLQLQYSLIERNIEHEFIPLGQELGMGITVWSPLGQGLLSGKYKPSGGGSGRLTLGGGGALETVGERNWQIVTALEQAAGEMGRSMAQVAINWAATQPGIGSVILGASKPEQLEDNLAALDFVIPDELRSRLDEASALPAPFPYSMFGNGYQSGLHGGASVAAKPAGYSRPIWT